MAQPNNSGFLYIGTATASVASSLPAPGVDVFQLVSEAAKIKLPDYKILRANYGVLSEKSKRTLGGKLDVQAATGSIVADKTDSQTRQILDDVKGGVPVFRNWKFVEPDEGDSEVLFVGFVESLERSEYDAEGDGAPLLWDISIAINGDVTE